VQVQFPNSDAATVFATQEMARIAAPAQKIATESRPETPTDDTAVATAHLVLIGVVKGNEKGAQSEVLEMKIGNVVMGFAPERPKTTSPVKKIALLQDAVETGFVTSTRIVRPVHKIVEVRKRTTANTGFVVEGGLLAPTNVATKDAFSVPVMHRVQLDRLQLP